MSKASEKWIDFGTTAGQVADRSLPSVYTPINYTPSAVGSEGSDKTSAHLKGIDAELGVLAASVGPRNFEFTTSGATSQFSVSGGGLTVNSIVNVWVQGIKQREGASFAWQRNVGSQRIDMVEAVPDGLWVQIQIQ